MCGVISQPLVCHSFKKNHVAKNLSGTLEKAVEALLAHEVTFSKAGGRSTIRRRVFDETVPPFEKPKKDGWDSTCHFRGPLSLVRIRFNSAVLNELLQQGYLRHAG